MEFAIFSVCSLTKVEKLLLFLSQITGILGEVVICNEFKKLRVLTWKSKIV